MKKYIPPHDAFCKETLNSMVNTILSEISLPPIVVCGEKAITGSHRIGAYLIAHEMFLNCASDVEVKEIPVVDIDNDDYELAMSKVGLDPEFDEIFNFNEFCSALYDIVDCEDAKRALADQRY